MKRVLTLDMSSAWWIQGSARYKIGLLFFLAARAPRPLFVRFFSLYPEHMNRFNRFFGGGQRDKVQGGGPHPAGGQNETTGQTDHQQGKAQAPGSLPPVAAGTSSIAGSSIASVGHQGPQSSLRVVPAPSIPPAVSLTGGTGGFHIVNKKRTHDKLDRIAFHPVHSLIAMSDRSGRVQVYDYVSDTVAYSNQFGGVDEGGMQEIVLRRRAERYSAIINSAGIVDQEDADKDAVVDVRKGEKKLNQSDVRYQGMGVASGKVVDVGFVDWHMCVWQLHRQDSMMLGEEQRAVEPLDTLDEGMSKHHCWVMIASENKVTLHDLASSRGVDFVRNAYFDGSKPTRVACLVRVGRGLVQGGASNTATDSPNTPNVISPVLAVGTSTGSIYLIQVSTGKMIGKCSGAHSKGVTCLQVIGPARRGGPDRLVSGSADGTIAVWDPSRSMKSIDTKGSVCIQPNTCFMAHEGGVHDVQLFGMQVQVESPGTDGRERREKKSSYSTTMTELQLRPYLASTGADKQLCTWSVATWNKAYLPIQALPESSLVSIGCTSRAGTGLGSNAPLVGISDKSCAVFALDPSAGSASGGSVRVLVDLEGVLEKGDKKRPKIYTMAVNPSTPYVYGLATNTGLVIVEDHNGATVPSSTSLLSQHVFASSFIEMELNKKDTETEGDQVNGNGAERGNEDGADPGPMKIPQGITSINVVNGNLVATLYEMKIDVTDASGRRERTMHLENIGSLAIAGDTGAHSDILGNVGGDATIETSPSGKYISVVWPESNRYAVFAHCEPDDYGRRWRIIDGGEGRQLVWSSTAPIYAVLSYAGGVGGAASVTAPGTVEATLDNTSLTPGFSMTYADIPHVRDNVDGNGGDDAANGQDLAAASAGEDVPSATDDQPAPSYDEVMATDSLNSHPPDKSLSIATTSVRVHAIQETEDGRDPTYMGYSDIALGSDVVALKVHGGSLLGISSHCCSAASEASNAGRSKATLRFYSWVDVSPIGADLPAPNWISWDPESTVCALGYDTAIQICAVYPYFHCFATLGIHKSESAFWQIRQLYVSTPTSINVVYVDSRHSFVEEICLADFTGQSSSIRPVDSSLAAKKQENFVFGQRRLRPSGPVRLVGIKHSYLVVHDSLERPFLISLRNHGLRARSLAAKGDIDTAVALTAKYVRPVLHDGTAQCILAMGADSDYDKVLTLPGLSPEMRISISIRHGDWNRAARAFQAYSLGVNDAVYASLINEEVALFSSPGGLKSLQTASQRDVIGERNMAAVNNILEEAERKEQMGLDSPSDAEDARDETSPAVHYGEDFRDDSSAASSEDSDGSDDSDAFVDPIDWTSWGNVTSTTDATVPPFKSSSDHNSSSASHSMPIVDHAELLRILESTDLGLELASSSLESHRDSSKQILGTLLAYASDLSKDRLEQLVDQMAMASMTESLRNLWSETVSAAKGSTQSVSVAALLAASVGGIQESHMVESLKEAGLYPLAFLYASVWGTSGGANQVETVEAAWKQALA